MKKHAHVAHTWSCSTFFRAALLALVAGIPAVLPWAADAQDRKYSLKIQNDSRYDIYRLFMSESDEEEWGPDQLQTVVLESGETYTLTDIKPGEYDIKFVDEDGDECVLRDVAIFENTSWVLTTQWLVRCEKFS